MHTVARNNFLRALSRACACLLISTTLAVAADARSTTYQLDIPAQALDDALQALALASQHKLFYDAAIVRGKTSPALKGQFTAEEAVKQLLSGTNLSYEVTDDGLVMIRTPSVPATTSPSSRDSGPGSKAQSAGVTELEEVLVTGSRFSETPRERAGSVQIYSREQIDRSGQTGIAGFLGTLPNVSLASSETSLQTLFGGTTVQLRGLPVGTTLVLVNGQRVGTTGSQRIGNFFDLNSIPLAAVDRVEIVPDGSSAIYGSDAIAGVVNIILKKSFSGSEISSRYGWMRDSGDSSSSIAFGDTWSRGSALIMGTYQTRDGVPGASRALTASNDYTSYGGPNNNFSVCDSANVYALNGNLPGIDAPVAAASGTISGNPGLESFTPGSLNTCAFFSRTTSLLPTTKRGGFLAAGEWSPGDAITFVGELLYSHATQTAYSTPAWLFGIPGFQQFTLGPDNPANPFGERVGVGVTFPRHLQGDRLETDYVRPLLGARGNVGSTTWRWELNALQSQDFSTDTVLNANLDAAAIQAALDSGVSASALNPFNLSTSPLVDSFFENASVKFQGRTQALNAYARGTVADLPAGPLEMVVGGEYVRSRLYSNFVDYPGLAANTRSTTARRASALFTEVRVPLLGATSADPQRQRVRLTIAGRRDEYGDFGATTNPQFALEWRPAAHFVVRGTHAKAFKAPSLYDLYTPVQRIAATLVTDPRTGQPVVVPEDIGGNAALRPERGKSDTFGVTYSDESGALASLTYWRIQQSDTIKAFQPQDIVDNESAFPGRVTRDGSGAITLIDATRANFGDIDVSGADLRLTHTIRSSVGTWVPSVGATWTREYRVKLAPDSPLTDRASRADATGWAPRWKGNLGLTWTAAYLTSSLSGRYVGGYQDYDASRALGDFWLVDANVSYALGRALNAGNPLARGVSFQLGATNLLDRTPQFSGYSAYFVGYDPTQADILGRVIYTQASLSW